MKQRSAIAILFLLNTFPVFAARYVPVASGMFSTGQWYFDGKESSLGGDAAVTFVPALQFSNRLALIPTLESNYQGTRSAEELAGGNTFFQDTWSNGVNLKAVHNFSERWSVRERVGYRMKWFRETTDERWNHGLYDYRFPTIGVETGYDFSKRLRLTVGYDFSYLQFPNYVSLESQQSTDNAREFSGGAVLDSRVHLWSARTTVPLFWKMSSEIMFTYSPRDYIDQHVVVLSGELTSERRRDLLTSAALNLNRTFHMSRSTKLIGGLQYNHYDFNSNQNHYDAAVTHFVPDFYDYDQNGIGTQLTLAFGTITAGPMLIDAGYNYSHRNYRSRVIQSNAGAYMSEKLYQIDQNINLGFSYPLTRAVRVRATSTFGQSLSSTLGS